MPVGEHLWVRGAWEAGSETPLLPLSPSLGVWTECRDTFADVLHPSGDASDALAMLMQKLLRRNSVTPVMIGKAHREEQQQGIALPCLRDDRRYAIMMMQIRKVPSSVVISTVGRTASGAGGKESGTSAVRVMGRS